MLNPRIVFYDRSGTAVAYCDDSEHIYLFGGESVAYMDADAVYSYRGELLGWFESGWLRDKDGRCLAFAESATGGPPRPTRKADPYQAMKQSMPIQEHQDPRSLRPIHSNAWSAQTALEFFSRLPQRWPGDLGGNG